MPTLSLDKIWTDGGDGTHVSAPAETTRTEKVNKVVELSPATEHHPAQVQMTTIDEIVGTWKTLNLSGAIRNNKKQLIVSRVRELKNAVIFAREEANSVEVKQISYGADMFTWLLNDIA